MIANVQSLPQTALGLPDKERAELAASLIESLEELSEAGSNEAWAEEVRRRVSELDSGAVKAIAWDEARRITSQRDGRP